MEVIIYFGAFSKSLRFFNHKILFATLLGKGCAAEGFVGFCKFS